mmetsp:Transcript_58128/g.104741  ORF Transcript_58128/g.104741 Transcript_58128/m.104741 type:complete len:83 (+) Transcript_58128:153-401(+)
MLPRRRRLTSKAFFARCKYCHTFWKASWMPPGFSGKGHLRQCSSIHKLRLHIEYWQHAGAGSTRKPTRSLRQVLPGTAVCNL